MNVSLLIVVLALAISFAGLNAWLQAAVFPDIKGLSGEIAKHFYEGVIVILAAFVVISAQKIVDWINRLLGISTEKQDLETGITPETRHTASSNPLSQAILLILLLSFSLQLIQALVNVFIDIFDQLRAEREIGAITDYGLHVIDSTLVGYLFLFSWLPFCIVLVARATRKIGRNPGFWYFCAIATASLFSMILVNYLTTVEWTAAFVDNLAPILDAEPGTLRPRDVALVLTMQIIGILALSFILAAFMWLVSGMRMRVGSKLDSLGL